MLNTLRPALALLAAFTVITGILYPLAVTGVAQILFPFQANGSIISIDGRPAGSALIGQSFDDPRYFRGRPSATTPVSYNAASSAGSNFGQANPALHERVAAKVSALRDADPSNTQPVPADLVTASASGLDPHISPLAAEFQIGWVARARGLDEGRVRALIAEHIEERTFALLGEPRVNVLSLNLALDELR